MAKETSPLLKAVTPAPVATLSGAAAVNNYDSNAEAERQGDCRDEISERTATPVHMALIFPAISLGIFMSAADATIATVSYATICSELDALNQASWIMTAYTLSLASVQPLYGKLSDVLGHKTCLIAAYTLFAAGCLSCALARSMGQLIAARVLQAVGGSGMGTVVPILLTALVPPQDRGLWQGLVNVIYALGAGLGAPVGGALAASVGWRWAFWGQVPICVVAVLLVMAVVPHDVGRKPGYDARTSESGGWMAKLRRIDFIGSGLLIVTIASFIFGLDRGANLSWSAPEVWLSCTVSLLAGLSFFYVELSVAREPIIPPAVSFQPELASVYLVSFLCFFGIIAVQYTLPLYYQAAAGRNPGQASLYLLPSIIVSPCNALLVGYWMRRTGQYYWAILMAFTFQSIGTLTIVLLSGPVARATVGMVAAHVVTDLGASNLVISALMALLANTPADSIAVITAVYYTIRNLGSVLGVSVVSTVVQVALRRLLVVELQPYNLDVDAIMEAVRESLDSISTLDPTVAAVVRDCYGRAITQGMLVVLAAVVCGFVPAALVRGGRG